MANLNKCLHCPETDPTKFALRTDTGKSRNTCNSCRKRRDRARYLAKKEQLLEGIRSNYWQNRDARILQMRAWQKSNPDKVNAKAAKRRATRAKATPKWLTEEHNRQIKALYTESVRVTRDTGIKHVVDHIVPLINPNLCGLHVPWNLRVITEIENQKKHNKVF